MQIGVQPPPALFRILMPLPCVLATCGERDRVDRVDLAAEQRVDARGVVGEVDDHDLVEVRLPVRQ